MTFHSTKKKSDLTKKCLIAVTALTTFSIIGAASSSASTQSTHHHRHLMMMAVPQPQQTARDPQQTADSPRDAALRECNDAARKYTERDWQTLSAGTYAGCMTSHGQIP